MVYVSRRIGGDERAYLHPPKDYRMRMPDGLLYSVCFIVKRPDAREDDYLGTGFFVSVPPISGQGRKHVYLVTAKHVLPRSRSGEPPPPPVYIRVARWDENNSIVPHTMVVNGEWIHGHDPDENDQLDADVSIIPFGTDETDAPAANISIKAFARPPEMAEFEVGIGDDLAVIGLYLPRPGKEKVLPIVRSGVIAAMPDEPIMHPATAQLYRAYLAELRSYAGLSGSPVFVNVGPDRHADGQPNKAGRYFLLGVIRSHFYYKPGQDKSPLAELHMGITAVTPIDEVLKLLSLPKLRGDRVAKENERRRASRFGIAEDSAHAN